MLVAWLTVGRHRVPVERPAHVSLPVRAARRDLYANAINEALIARPGIWLTRALVYFDNRGVDGLVNGMAAGLGGSSGRLRRLQTGFVRSYALSMLGGSVLVIGALLAVVLHVNLLLPVLLVFPLVGALVMYPLREHLGAGQEGRDGHRAAADRARGRHLVRLLGACRGGRHPVPAPSSPSSGSRPSAPGSRSASTASRSS